MQRLIARGVIAVVASTCGAASAQAATYVVAPSGTGTACTAEAPCALTYASDRTADGDEVVLRPGVYDVGETQGPFGLIGRGKEGVVLRGDGKGAGTATIRGTVATPGGALVTVGGGSQIRDLTIVGRDAQANGTTVVVEGEPSEPRSVVERVRVEGDGFDSLSLSHDALVRDAVLLSRSSTGGAALAVFQGARASARNVTALGQSIGVWVGESGTTLGLRNSIARSLGAGFDIDRQPEAQAVAVAYSNFRNDRVNGTVNRVGDVHYADIDPLVDATTGRPAINSPLRDKGDDTASDLGTDDALGRPRRLGAAIDVGAVELLPPAAVSSAPATAVAVDRATVGGTVDPGGVPVAVRLEVAGRVIDLGTTSGPRTYAHEVAGLQPQTSYSARLVAAHEEGEFAGAVTAFTTAAPAVTPPSPTAALTAATLARSTFSRRRSTVLRLALARPAAATLSVHRVVAGRRRGRTCVPRARRGRRCTRETRLSRSTIDLGAGRFGRRFAPRARRGRLLPAGRYVLVVEVEGRKVRLPFRLGR